MLSILLLEAAVPVLATGEEGGPGDYDRRAALTLYRAFHPAGSYDLAQMTDAAVEPLILDKERDRGTYLHRLRDDEGRPIGYLKISVGRGFDEPGKEWTRERSGASGAEYFSTIRSSSAGLPCLTVAGHQAVEQVHLSAAKHLPCGAEKQQALREMEGFLTRLHDQGRRNRLFVARAENGRDPREVDYFLDRLGMMLAAAAAAPQPEVTRDFAGPGYRPFDWYDADHLAQTVTRELHKLRSDAGRFFRVELSREQVQRMKALLYWSQWILARTAAEAVCRAPTSAITSSGPSEVVGSPIDVTAAPAPGEPEVCPEPPLYPLRDPVPEDLLWPEQPLPVAFDGTFTGGRELDILLEGTVTTAIDYAILAGQAADLYWTGGYGFLALTSMYGAFTGELTPLAWQLMIMDPSRIVGPSLIAALALSEAASGQELQVRMRPVDGDEYDPIEAWDSMVEGRGDHRLETGLRQLTPVERMGRTSMAVLVLTGTVGKRLRLGSLAESARQPRLADPQVPPFEGGPGGNPLRPARVAGATRPAADGRATQLIEIDQPIIAAEVPDVGRVGRLRVQMRVVEQGGEYFHPETGEKLPFLGHEGYHGFKHFYERYAFGDVERIWSLGRRGNRVEIPRGEWGALFEHANHKYYIKEVPPLQEVFGDHAGIRAAADALDAVLSDPTTSGQVRQIRYVEFINSILREFSGSRNASAVWDARYGSGENVSLMAVTHKGHTLMVPIRANGQLANAFVLSRGFNAGRLMLRHPLEGSVPPELALMGDLVETIVLEPVMQASLRTGVATAQFRQNVSRGIGERGLAYQLSFKTREFRTALRNDALVWYRTGRRPSEEEREVR